MPKHMSIKGFQVRGDKNNPFHLSLGQVLLNSDNKIALVKKSDNTVTLPRETVYIGETLEECLKRGAEEEIGVTIGINRYIGPLLTGFNREDGSIIEKTTLYFETTQINSVKRNPKLDEQDDEILWLTKEDAINIFYEQNNFESEIVKRTF